MSDQNNIHVVSRAIILDQEHILLCKTINRPNNFYFLPGGHIEHGESAKEALLRELLEETGDIFKVENFLGCFEHISNPENKGIHDHEYNFIFKAESDHFQFGKFITQLEENIELLWIPLNKINETDFRPETLKKNILKLIVKNDTINTNIL
ncbi:MAG: NUDIX domain-containing protein [Rickettsiales bacterium]|jgi:ADP-ribose pyrophosphatase YjhB (NUDIX family)|nr:NUDIX domain-containing protein [Rickettsiales bacterium]